MKRQETCAPCGVELPCGHGSADRKEPPFWSGKGSIAGRIIGARWLGTAAMILDVDGVETAVIIGTSLSRQLLFLAPAKGTFVEIIRKGESSGGFPEYELRVASAQRGRKRWQAYTDPIPHDKASPAPAGDGAELPGSENHTGPGANFPG